MVLISLQSLSDLCGIRIAYLMWTRRGLVKKGLKEILFNEEVDAVLSDVQRLPLPEKLKPIILKHSGSHLRSLLSLWLFTQPETQKWLTDDMLFHCLVLNADGLINQRKTAEAIIGNRMLNNEFAFRLACINFLEKEVLKLWIVVKEYFLNKIILEGAQANTSLERSSFENDIDLNGMYYSFNMREYAYSNQEGNLSQFPLTTEREEVLFWISYCLSKENAIGMTAIPHFKGYDFDWYAFSLEFATFSGNVACFDYFNNFHDSRIEYNNVNIIQKIFYSQEGEEEKGHHPCFDRQMPCFTFHYALLTSEEEAYLFQKFPGRMFSYFYQWPFSLTYLDKLERLWNLVSDRYKPCRFAEILDIFFSENILLQPTTNSLFYYVPLGSITGIYSSEHLIRIWVTLWDMDLDSSKSKFLESRVFSSIQYATGYPELSQNLITPGLKERLRQLFLSNAEAILELYKIEGMKDSLRNLVAKYMPEHFEELNRRCISIPSNQTSMVEIWMEPNSGKIYDEKNYAGPIHEMFLNYISKYLFSSKGR